MTHICMQAWNREAKTGAYWPKADGAEQAQDVVEEREQHRQNRREAHVQRPPNQPEEGKVIDSNEGQPDALIPVDPGTQAPVGHKVVHVPFHEGEQRHRPYLRVVTRLNSYTIRTAAPTK